MKIACEAATPGPSINSAARTAELLWGAESERLIEDPAEPVTMRQIARDSSDSQDS